MTDENRMTGLHHICMHSQDIRLLRLLCDNGADLNAEDSHGNTPLLSLCDMATARLYDSFEDLSPCSEDSASSFIGPSAVNAQFLDFLLQMKDVDVSFVSFLYIFSDYRDSSTSHVAQKFYAFHTLRPKHLDITLFSYAALLAWRFLPCEIRHIHANSAGKTHMFKTYCC